MPKHSTHGNENISAETCCAFSLISTFIIESADDFEYDLLGQLRISAKVELSYERKVVIYRLASMLLALLFWENSDSAVHKVRKALDSLVLPTEPKRRLAFLDELENAIKSLNGFIKALNNNSVNHQRCAKKRRIFNTRFPVHTNQSSQASALVTVPGPDRGETVL